jgi:GDP-L-fucose synthase
MSPSKLYIAGHTGLIGSALLRRFRVDDGYTVLTADHRELELQDANAVQSFFDHHLPDCVILAAGKVGGIMENSTLPADFIRTNLAIQLNVLEAAHRAGVKRLLLFASSCMYPRDCPQPMGEDQLFTGVPELTSMAYAISKMAGMQLCLAYNQQYGRKHFIPLIPNSVYGPNDNFDPDKGHVLSSLIRRFHEARIGGAKSVRLWGNGMPRREFVYADDLAEACALLLRADISDIGLPINVGTGEDIDIKHLAELIATTVGYRGDIEWDINRPNGAPRKLLNSGRIQSIGWRARTELHEGVSATYSWYLKHIQAVESVT